MGSVIVGLRRRGRARSLRSSARARRARRSAAAPCWQRVTLDWAADGSVDKTYPLACYQQAIDNHATTIGIYSSFEDDIRRASSVRSRQGSTTRRSRRPRPTRRRPSDDGGVPVPLLVLGGVAILLVARGRRGHRPQARPRHRPEPGLAQPARGRSAATLHAGKSLENEPFLGYPSDARPRLPGPLRRVVGAR